MKILLCKLLLPVLFFALAAPLHAHFVWIERNSQGASAYFGEWAANVRENQDGYLKLIAGPRAFLADGTELTITRAHDRLNIAVTEAGDVRLIDTYFGEKTKNLTVYQAKNGRAETVAKFDLELVPVEANSNSFLLLLRGEPVSDADVTLFTSSGWSRTFKTEASGRVTIETPWPGPAVVEVVYLEKKSGEHQGRAYEAIRHVSTLTFEVVR